MEKQKRKITIYLPIIFALILIIGIYAGVKLAPISVYNHNALSFKLDGYNKINDIINYISQDYVDSVSRKDLTEDAITGILENLDPHSQYISANELIRVNEDLMGNFEGIGVQFRIEKDTIMILHTINGGPSDQVGILGGDRIVIIEDSLVAGIGLTDNQAISMLKGPKGSKVNIDIFRRGFPGLLEFKITRDVIPTYSIDISYKVNDTVGYIKLNRFSATTYQEFSEALKEMTLNGINTLILDLRGNTGGYLQASIDIADEFLKDKKLIVYTEGKNRPKSTSFATKKGIFHDGEVYVLIDEGSASASEIVAGAIQDNDRGTIIGRRSFGKGLVQEQLNLPDGSAIRLTVARYHTPTGRCIQRPYDNGSEDYYNDFYKRFTNGELTSVDSIPKNDTLKYFTPEGKVVYGGGGIMPDFYIPVPRDENSGFLNQLLRRGMLYRFAFQFVDKNRKDLMAFVNTDDFIENFKLNNLIYNEFQDYISKNGISLDKNSSPEEINKLKILLKANIGRTLFNDEGFYPVYHQVDDAFQKAMEIISEKQSI